MDQNASQTKRHPKAYTTLVGCTIFFLWAGSFYCTSQISPYVASYYGVSVSRTEYIIPFSYIINCCFHPIGSIVAHKMHPKLGLGILGMLGPITLWLSSFMPTFGSWVALYLFAYSAVNGLTYLTAVHQGWMWFPDKPGLASGIIIGGYGFSGLIFN